MLCAFLFLNLFRINDPIVLQSLLNAGSLCSILRQQLSHQLFRLIGNALPYWAIECQLCVFDVVDYFLVCLAHEWRLPR